MLDELEGWHANTLEKRIGISQGFESDSGTTV